MGANLSYIVFDIVEQTRSAKSDAKIDYMLVIDVLSTLTTFSMREHY